MNTFEKTGLPEWDDQAKLQSQLASIVESSDEAIISKDINGIILSWNRGAERVFGYSAGEIVGSSILKLIPPDRHAEEEAILKMIHQGQRVDHFETVRLGKGGGLIDISVTISPIVDSGGKIVGASKIARDISARKKLEASFEEQRRTQAQLASIVEHSQDAIFSVTGDGTILTWNRGAERIFGFAAKEIVDSPITRLVPPAFQREVDEVCDRIKNDLVAHRLETVCLRNNGTLVDVCMTVSPIKERTGQLIGASIMAHDITERMLTSAKIEKQGMELFNSEQRYRFLADTMPQIIWTAKPDGSIDYYNQRWFDYTGLTFDQTKNWGWQPVIHPEDLQQCVDVWTRSFTTGCDYQVEYRFKRASDGVYRWHLGRAFPMRGEQGEIIQWVGTCTDIEDHKQSMAGLEKRVAERTEELAMINARLEALLKAATHVSIIAGDPNCLITVFNAGAERMLGYTADEMVGKQTPAVLHVESEVIARGRELSEEFGRVIEGVDVFIEFARQGRHEEREWTYVRKDGSHLTVNLVVTASKDTDGRITGYLGIAMDVTARKQTEKILRDQALILDLAHGAIVVRDLQDRVILWNQGAETMYGLTRGEAIGQITHDLLKTEFPQPLSEILGTLWIRRNWEGELVHTRRDGVQLAIGSRWTLQVDQEDRPIAIIEINYDISENKRREFELKMAKERAEFADRAKSEFLANMSHEIRTPMNGILGFSQFLASGKPGPLNGVQAEYLGDIMTCGNHLLKLIDDVLDLSKVEAGKMKLEVETFSLLQVLEEVCKGSQPMVDKKRIKLIRTVAPTLAEVTLDKHRVRQVLYNLVSNAIKFTADGGIVTVTADFEGSKRFHLKVKDTGIGIKPKDIKRLFKEFEQIESGMTRQYQGSGLGLALTRRIVEVLGGSIGVESEFGKGSTFTAIFPVTFKPKFN